MYFAPMPVMGDSMDVVVHATGPQFMRTRYPDSFPAKEY
jgi:hypothetical protein